MAAGAVLAGCSAPELGPEVAHEEPAPSGAPSTSESDPPSSSGDGADPQPPAGTTPPGEAPHGPDGAVPACDADTVRAIDEVVGEQLAAFARGDYERALEFASAAFRAGVEAEDLARIIEDGYPVAADAAAHETGLCVQPSPSTAEVLVEVTGADGSRGDLVYRLVTEGERWRIAGAVEVGSTSDPATTVGLAR